VPLPDRGIVRAAVEAVETTEMLPLALPAELGVKVVPKVKLCPAVKVIGRLSPLMPNPAPVTLACVIVTLEPPELVRVSVNV
jgi:hypothetical protein